MSLSLIAVFLPILLMPGIIGLLFHEFAMTLSIAILIVMFSGIDALLTLMLVERGAYEANPMMAPLVGGSAVAFTLVKIGLTAGGVVLLTQLARLRAFGRIPVGVLLYTVLGIYGALIAYEFGLLNAL